MRSLFATAVAVALASGCASVPVRRVGERRPNDPTWLKASGQQVRFVGSLELPEHLGIEKNAFTRFWQWLTGTEASHALYRPFGVAVAADGRVAVTDPGVRAVRLYLPADGTDLELREGLTNPLAVAFVGEMLAVADGTLATLVGFDAKTGERRPLEWKLPVFSRPTGLAFDAARGRLFVVDAGLHCVHVVSVSGAAPLRIGARGEALGAFNFPTHVAVDARGHLFVTDSMNFRVQHFDEQLEVVGTLGGLGDTVGDLPRSKGVTIDSRGTLWVVEGAFDVVQGFDTSGELVGVFGGSGVTDGRFWLPAGITSDAQGRIYVADTWNARVQVFVIEPVPVVPAITARVTEAR
ncbi:MAG: hypothetical protein Q8L14_38230 [Myxococcales bacterium]|nr:hypothetical protein [Myxococcales bacterium]